MITAIPMSRDKIAAHFSKADSFVFINEQGTSVVQAPNPGLENGCAGKANIITLLQQQQVDRVIVRNIGERFLARLLDAKFQVFQSGSSHFDSVQLQDSVPRFLLPLTAAEQGRPSVNYQKKQAAGGCGCDHDAEHGHCCHDDKGHADQHGHAADHVPCCQRKTAAGERCGGCCRH
ncbi:hypothetical protein JYB87_15970 [Shewanella avicenniae]|uniref:Dinitrogenase iron-molybdenum cofactor biosynthesis domain-containing protein n=1 Tax=Shewanella avicenniae TaxID=2814294 RepID=A0ABX7QR85_9GAMM|nr:NifB/NifX family molybdenum-iron cluster-binding protein [Shewanella avicenniae]QSX33201.1 hypothetical protein JYB87_15970 [Shewanella avicenniae]